MVDPTHSHGATAVDHERANEVNDEDLVVLSRHGDSGGKTKGCTPRLGGSELCGCHWGGSSWATPISSPHGNTGVSVSVRNVSNAHASELASVNAHAMPMQRPNGAIHCPGRTWKFATSSIPNADPIPR